MNLITMLAVVLPVLLSSAASAFRAYLDYKKSKVKERDYALDAAVSVAPQLCISDPDEFASLYLTIRFSQDHPEALAGKDSLSEAVRAYYRGGDSKV